MPELMRPDGAKIAYNVTGSGPPVLMIQGTGVKGCGWKPQVAGLQDRYTLATFDNRGIGESAFDGAFRMQDLADDALAVMDALGWQQAHVVGHSLGGLIAQCVAITAPSRVLSLGLLCTIGEGKEATRLSAKMAWLGMRSYVGTRRMRRHAFLKMVMPPDVIRQSRLDALADEMAEVFERDLADSPDVTMRQLRAMNQYSAYPDHHTIAHIPTLVVAGEHDPIASPETARKLARSLSSSAPDVRLVELTNTSHAVVVQRADHINALLAEHFVESAGREVGASA